MKPRFSTRLEIQVRDQVRNETLKIVSRDPRLISKRTLTLATSVAQICDVSLVYYRNRKVVAKFYRKFQYMGLKTKCLLLNLSILYNTN